MRNNQLSIRKCSRIPYNELQRARIQTYKQTNKKKRWYMKSVGKKSQPPTSCAQLTQSWTFEIVVEITWDLSMSKRLLLYIFASTIWADFRGVKWVAVHFLSSQSHNRTFSEKSHIQKFNGTIMISEYSSNSLNKYSFLWISSIKGSEFVNEQNKSSEKSKRLSI